MKKKMCTLFLIKKSKEQLFVQPSAYIYISIYVNIFVYMWKMVEIIWNTYQFKMVEFMLQYGIM